MSPILSETEAFLAEAEKLEKTVRIVTKSGERRVGKVTSLGDTAVTLSDGTGNRSIITLSSVEIVEHSAYDGLDKEW